MLSVLVHRLRDCKKRWKFSWGIIVRWSGGAGLEGYVVDRDQLEERGCQKFQGTEEIVGKKKPDEVVPTGPSWVR